MKTTNKLLGLALAVAVVGAGAPLAHAALTANSTLSQSITAGTLSTDIRDASNNLVSAPTFNMTGVNVSTSQQTATGTFGTSAQRISIDNPGAVTTQSITLTLAATGGASATWTSGSNTYAFNGASAANGQLTVDPAPSTWTARTGTTTGITKGSAATFSGGLNTPVTIATLPGSLEDIWNGYVTGIGLSQTIPANTPVGTYTISMTQTVAAV